MNPKILDKHYQVWELVEWIDKGRKILIWETVQDECDDPDWRLDQAHIIMKESMLSGGKVRLVEIKIKIIWEV